ncbi:MAG: hypothetical protein SAJ72_15515, partial [Jaaginema sp. PMC 1080.18]|nr:hypothetical protein [Jaaginema sp. PMC 1080.18]
FIFKVGYQGEMICAPMPKKWSVEADSLGKKLHLDRGDCPKPTAQNPLPKTYCPKPTAQNLSINHTQ